MQYSTFISKGTSPRPDGFSVEYFLVFYELIKGDILKGLRESQRSSKIIESMKSTFLELIPKKQKTNEFADFRPISCCNIVYKIIAKIIAQSLKPILSQIVSEE